MFTSYKDMYDSIDDPKKIIDKRLGLNKIWCGVKFTQFIILKIDFGVENLINYFLTLKSFFF